MKIEYFSHNFGKEAVNNDMLNNIRNDLEKEDFNFRPRCSSELRETILNNLYHKGWSDEINIDSESNITITSMKNQVGLCLQTGNVSRFYADLLKLETLYRKNKIKCGIIIVPKKITAKKMGSNVANYERLIQELNMYKHIITIPICVIGIRGGSN